MEAYITVSIAVAMFIFIGRLLNGWDAGIPVVRHISDTVLDCILYGTIWPLMLCGTVGGHYFDLPTVSNDIVYHRGHWAHILMPFGYKFYKRGGADAGQILRNLGVIMSAVPAAAPEYVDV